MRIIPTDRVAYFTWFVYVDGKKTLKQINQKYSSNKYDAVCSCGYETTTNGAKKDTIRNLIYHHKLSQHKYIFKLNCGCTTDFQSNTKHNDQCKSVFTNKQLVAN